MATVLIGVTGGVAIYKTCDLIRILQKAGVRVKVCMTESATHFINPLLFRSLTREPVAVGLFDDRPGDPIHHISLAREADVMVIAPCTANVIAKMANGIADDLLTTTALATSAKLMVAPAMNPGMYNNPATLANIETLRSRGVQIIEPDVGYVACGETGKGRLAEPKAIAEVILEALGISRDLEGVSVLVTAGPTVEPIDPVRFISNRSSGKMGYAIARDACNRGANVVLVSGPVALQAPQGAQVVHVETAQEMYDAVEQRFDDTDIAVFCAAVCDMAPVTVAEGKLKKGVDDEALSSMALEPTPDILAAMGKRARKDQVVVGFAAETSDLLEHAREKLAKKRATMIVGNIVGKDKGFGTDDNEAVIVSASSEEALPLQSKDDLAHAILDRAAALLDR